MEKIIQGWINKVIKEGSWEHFNNLHLDAVYDRGTPMGVLAGIKVLNTAADYLVSCYPGYRVALGFSLNSSEWPMGINFSNVNELDEQIGQNPGAVFLYREETPDWQKTFNRCSRVLLSDLYIDLLYAEYKLEDELDYRRLIWVKALI